MNHEVAGFILSLRRRHDLDIASLRILGTDDGGVLVCFSEAAAEDLHVVAVQMDLRMVSSVYVSTLERISRILTGCGALS